MKRGYVIGIIIAILLIVITIMVGILLNPRFENKNNLNNTVINCAKEGEDFSEVYIEDFPPICCEGLRGWYSGFDTSISIADYCYETGLLSGNPVGTCINCGNRICEDIESPCNCPEDCLGKNESTYNTIQEFCDEGFDSFCQEEALALDLDLCKLC